MQGDRLIARLKPVGKKATPDEGGRLRFIDADRDERMDVDPPLVLADLYRQRVHSHERVGGIERPVAERLDLNVQVRGPRGICAGVEGGPVLGDFSSQAAIVACAAAVCGLSSSSWLGVAHGGDRLVEVVRGERGCQPLVERVGEAVGDVSTAAAPILRLSRTGLPTSVLSLIRIRLTVTEKRRVGILAMHSQRMIEYRQLGSEQSRLGCHAHRRTEDSILSIMPGSCQALHPTRNPRRIG